MSSVYYYYYYYLFVCYFTLLFVILLLLLNRKKERIEEVNRRHSIISTTYTSGPAYLLIELSQKRKRRTSDSDLTINKIGDLWYIVILKWTTG
jgi:hypothetical protein